MATPPRVRKTQAERTEQTRQLLIDATIRSVRDNGYRATTTRRIADYAGVSLGAVAHHFPTRALLVGAALDTVSARLAHAIETETETIAARPGRDTELLLDLLWSNFSGESFLVWLRLWLAAAEEPELRDAVIAADQRLAHDLARLLPPLAPAGHDRRDWMRRVNVALDTIRGLSLLTHHQPSEAPPADRWPSARRELVRLLDGPPPDTRTTPSDMPN